MISQIKIRDFKKVKDATLILDAINVLVGGNNSGKSCFLQGIHFGISLAQARKVAGSDQFSPEQLRYCPTDSFLDLRRGSRLTENSQIAFTYEQNQSDLKETASINLHRGRNGVVRATMTGTQIFLDKIANPKGYFSIFVPGLAGISIREEYRSDSVVNNGIARGDANLYLRNVLLRISLDQARQKKFQKYLSDIFPDCSVNTTFDHANDLWIKSAVNQKSTSGLSLDMAGTGLLQTIQLLAYVINYSPKLLLLDEPDAHLHPSNQRLLAKTLCLIAAETGTKIVLATHSRHLLDALSEQNSTALYWIKNGEAERQENWSDVAILMDLGALDSGEKLLAGQYKYLIWTEDSDIEGLKILLEANGYSLAECYIFSYATSSKIDAASMLARFAQEIRPGVKTIIHRDRDFMTDDEISRLKAKFQLPTQMNAGLFITRESDIESYFVSAEHLSNALNWQIADCISLLNSILVQNNLNFAVEFRDKREEIKHLLYKRDPQNCPATSSILSGEQISIEKVKGKSIQKILFDRLSSQGFQPNVIYRNSPALVDPELQSLK